MSRLSINPSVDYLRTFNYNPQSEESHKSDTFQPLFEKVLELCENGNDEIAYEMLWSGAAYSEEEAATAQAAKEKYT